MSRLVAAFDALADMKKTRDVLAELQPIFEENDFDQAERIADAIAVLDGLDQWIRDGHDRGVF